MNRSLGIRFSLVGIGLLASLVGSADAHAQNTSAPPSVQLSEATRERIRLEEAYRREVREALAGKSQGGSLSKALNAPITLWFLSSVVLSLWSWIYSRLRDRQSSKRLLNQKVSRILTDLRTRVIRARADLKGWASGGVSWTVMEKTEGAFPDFRERDFLSLATELGILLPDAEPPKKIAALWNDMLKEPDRNEHECKRVEELLARLDQLIEASARLTSA